jgi:hypothetical protein
VAISLPDSLFASGNYKLASLEYERLISIATEAKELNELRYKRAKCFKLLGEYTKAQVEFSKISYWALSDTLSPVYHYESALCDYLAGSFSNAVYQADQIDTSRLIDNDTKANIRLIKILSYNELTQWDKAKTEALLYNRTIHPKRLADSLENILVSYYEPKNLPRLKTEKKANFYRMMPGLGQAYAGKPLEGAVNFTLNLAFLSFGAYQIIEGYYLTGYFVGAIGLNKVYFGGHARTAILLAKYNYKVKKDFCEKIKLTLLNDASKY